MVLLLMVELVVVAVMEVLEVVVLEEQLSWLDQLLILAVVPSLLSVPPVEQPVLEAIQVVLEVLEESDFTTQPPQLLQPPPHLWLDMTAP